MTICTRKTGTRVVIPLHPVVRQILQKYKGMLPKSAWRDKTNKHIQTCAKLAGLDEEITLHRRKGGRDIVEKKPKYECITNHTARRSFCTNMVKRGVQIRAIMAISGHTTEDNFNKYIKVTQEEYAEIVAKSFQKIG